MIAITGRRTSTLGRAATVTIELGPLQEACSLGLAPSTSTTAMLAVGDALALVTSRMRDFGREDFARFHPAGNLGRQLSKVDDFMRPLAECRVAARIANACARSSSSAAAPAGAPARSCSSTPPASWPGMFTDSDLARLFEAQARRGARPPDSRSDDRATLAPCRRAR